MCRNVLVLASTFIIAVFGSVTNAKLEQMGCNFLYDNPSRSVRTWSFDYDLQLLTINEIVYEVDPKWSGFLEMGAMGDPCSTFDAVVNITNETGYTWTDYKIIYGPPPMIGDSIYIVPGSIETTKLQTIIGTQSGWLLSEPPAVFDGESFTMNFDMRTGSHGRYFLEETRWLPIPEPVTIVLFGVGGLALLKKRKP